MNSPTQSAAAALRTRLAEVDEKMAALHSQFEELAEVRRDVVDALASFVYPVLTLPSEITAEIFKHCVGPVGLGMGAGNAPLVLSSVCKDWRRIALDLASIWSDIWLASSSAPNMPSILKSWLPRTGTHPIDVTGLDTRHESINELVPYCEQWRSISCWLELPITGSLNDIRGRIPQLRSLDISYGGGPVESFANSIPLTMFSDAPNLRELSMTDQLPPSSPDMLHLFDLPWEGLTHLSSRVQGLDKVLQLLTRTPNLQSLSISPSSMHPAIVLPPPITLPRLRMLEICHKGAMVCDAIVAPSLKSLQITTPSEELGVPRLLARCESSLRSLSISGIDPPNWRFVLSVLRAAPMIEEAGLSMSSPLQQWRKLFSLIRSEKNFLPKLRVLSLTALAAVEIWNVSTFAEMTEMILERWSSDLDATSPSPGENPSGVQATHKLEAFRLVYSHLPDFSTKMLPNTPVTEWCVETLGILVKDGCKIKIQGLDLTPELSVEEQPSYTLDERYKGRILGGVNRTI
ncbi:hypothetical protein R3P38DRAFT_2905248 [Favolaschia claudopus]|uniref:F-box domain-containing protein n=1 Tax=Favolaschia claudopus TaxID=2862362 RepID=A0AAW0CHY3_9AGAR